MSGAPARTAPARHLRQQPASTLPGRITARHWFGVKGYRGDTEGRGGRKFPSVSRVFGTAAIVSSHVCELRRYVGSYVVGWRGRGRERNGGAGGWGRCGFPSAGGVFGTSDCSFRPSAEREVEVP